MTKIAEPMDYPPHDEDWYPPTVPVGKDILKEQDAIRLERWSAE